MLRRVRRLSPQWDKSWYLWITLRHYFAYEIFAEHQSGKEGAMRILSLSNLSAAIWQVVNDVNPFEEHRWISCTTGPGVEARHEWTCITFRQMQNRCERRDWLTALATLSDSGGSQAQPSIAVDAGVLGWGCSRTVLASRAQYTAEKKKDCCMAWWKLFDQRLSSVPWHVGAWIRSVYN
jgi:hypothetical protein